MGAIGHLKEGENIEMVVRRHWIVYIQLGIYAFLGISVTSTLLGFFGLQFWLILILCLFWMMFLLFLYIEWLNHELDLFIITNTRIIGVEQISFLNRTISECHLAQVQEVNAKTKGLLSNLLNFGTLLIQTAGNASNFEVAYAPDVINTSRKILNIVDTYRGDGSLKQRLQDTEKEEA
ncbi:MAG: hypothetical protein PHR68_04030 [Candidatus Gracilibacteria bacterium]|nr:hypothetical protein [Candidatus Gracilibacteria bacterium]